MSSSDSSPQDYRLFREQATTASDDNDDHPSLSFQVLNGKPYFPLLEVQVDDLDTVKRVAAAILGHESNAATTSNANETFSNLDVRTISGGITNTLFLVSGLGEPANQVLVRVFGAEGMIDRDVENCTFAALADFDDHHQHDTTKSDASKSDTSDHHHHHHHHAIAPPYYGRFANGRIEGWMDGFVHLQVREMAQPSIAAGIARKLGEMHSAFDVPDSLRSYYYNNGEAGLWTQLDEWFEQSLTNKYQTEHDTQRAAGLKLASTIPTELAWLRSQISDDTAAICFCHNDLLAANVLCKRSDDANNLQIQLIDFEYGGMNYRSFDIANHFCEYAGGPPVDATPVYEWLPTAQAQERFCRHYLTAYHENDASSPDVTDTAVDDLVHQVQAFMLASHLYWGLWAVNQAATEGCDEYDYMLYGQNRFAQYWISKQDYCQRYNVVV